MINRTFKVLIGKDIDSSEIDAGSNIAEIGASIAEGEILLLTEAMVLAAATPTYIENTTAAAVYVCQGSGETYDYTTETGSLVTGVRRVIVSDIIEGRNVVQYFGEAYQAKSEQVSTFTVGFTPVVGTEYLVRIRYKDIHEHPARFTQTYRYIATNATLGDLTTALAGVINADGGRRVNATRTGTTLVLTGRPIPECTTSLEDIDKFSMVEFDAYLNYVDSNGNWAATPTTSLATTAASYGFGNWEQVRDLEKAQFATKGITNKTLFPVKSREFSTVKGAYYDTITIVHNKDYVAPNNQGIEKARVTTYICIATAANGTNAGTAPDLFETQLNSWMHSLPQTFANLGLMG